MAKLRIESESRCICCLSHLGVVVHGVGFKSATRAVTKGSTGDAMVDGADDGLGEGSALNCTDGLVPKVESANGGRRGRVWRIRQRRLLLLWRDRGWTLGLLNAEGRRSRLLWLLLCGRSDQELTIVKDCHAAEPATILPLSDGGVRDVAARAGGGGVEDLDCRRWDDGLAHGERRG
jgi:hypothetical protein